MLFSVSEFHSFICFDESIQRPLTFPSAAKFVFIYNEGYAIIIDLPNTKTLMESFRVR